MAGVVPAEEREDKETVTKKDKKKYYYKKETCSPHQRVISFMVLKLIDHKLAEKIHGDRIDSKIFSYLITHYMDIPRRYWVKVIPQQRAYYIVGDQAHHVFKAFLATIGTKYKKELKYFSKSKSK